MASAFEQAVDGLRPIYADWARGEFGRRPGVYHAGGLEWGFSDELPDAGTEVDTSDRSERYAEWLSGWDEWRCYAQRYIDAGEQVVVFTRYTGRGRGSSVEVEREGAHIWTFRDGAAVRLVIFSRRERALAEVGIDPADASSRAALPQGPG